MKKKWKVLAIIGSAAALVAVGAVFYANREHADYVRAAKLLPAARLEAEAMFSPLAWEEYQAENGIEFRDDTAQSQSLEERVRAHGFILDVAELEQHSILSGDDSSPIYERLSSNWNSMLPRGLYFNSRVYDRTSVEGALNQIQELLPDVWEIPTRPRYYLAGDWSDSMQLLSVHTFMMKQIATVHRGLLVIAAEDRRIDDVLKSLVAMRTIADHARDNPGLIGTLFAQNIEELMFGAIVQSATYFSEDPEGIRLLREFVDSIQERPRMEALRFEIPLVLSVIDQLVAGELTLSQLYGPDLGEGIEETGADNLLQFADVHDPLRGQFLTIVLDYAAVWGDQAEVERVESAIEASFNEDTEDLAVMLLSMAMLALSPMYSPMHANEQIALADTRITKIGLAAMDLHLQNGEWPTLEAAAELAQVVTLDPFGGQLHYVPDGDSLLMYSIGRDQIDDGGTRRSGSDGTYDHPTTTFHLNVSSIGTSPSRGNAATNRTDQQRKQQEKKEKQNVWIVPGAVLIVAAGIVVFLAKRSARINGR